MQEKKYKNVDRVMDVEEVYRHVDRVLDVQKVLGLESHIVLIDLMVMGIRTLDSLSKFCF